MTDGGMIIRLQKTDDGESVKMKLSTRIHQGDSVPATSMRRLAATALPIGAFTLVLTVAACGPPPQPLAGTNVLDQKLGPSTNIPGAMTFRAPDLDSKPAPKCFYIPDTIIDNGKEAVFVDVNEQQKQAVAQEVTTAFRHAIGQHQRVSPAPSPDCVTLQLYLTGIDRAVPIPPGAEANYGILMGGLGLGRNLSVYGSITVAGKFIAPDGTALAGFVNRVETNSINISPSSTPRQIAAITAQRLANEIAVQVDQEVALQKSNQKS
jgi:hypothetical protein